MLSKPARFGGGGATGHLGGGIPRSGGKTIGKGRGRGALTSRGSGNEEANGKTLGEAPDSPNREKKSRRVKVEKDKDAIKPPKSAAISRPRRVKKEKSDQGPEVYTSVDDDGEETDAYDRKLNIDFISLLSDNEDDNSDDPQEVRNMIGEAMDLGDTAAHSPIKPQHHSLTSFRPVRLERQEHVERPLAGISAGSVSGTYLSSAELRRKAKEKADAQGSLFIDDDDDEDEMEEKRMVGSWGHNKGRGKGRDVQVLGRKKVWKGAWGDDDDDTERQRDVMVKEEPVEEVEINVELEVEDGDCEDDGSLHRTTKASYVGPHRKSHSFPSSSLLIDKQPTSEHKDSRRRTPSTGLVAPQYSTAIPQQDSSTDSEGPIAPITHRRRRSSPNIRPIRLQKPKFQTPEEQLEWLRYVEDLRLMGDLLRSGSTTRPAASADEEDETKKDVNKDTQGPTQPDATTDAKAGRIYMMQLPPLLPQMEARKPTLSPPAERAPTGQAKSFDSDAAAPPREDSPPQPDLPLLGLMPATLPTTLQAGRVGYLRLHASSRITMTWGDMLFSLGRSANDGGSAGGGSLQEVVVMNYDDGSGVKEEKQEVKVDKSRRRGKGKEDGENEGIFKIKIEDDGSGQGTMGDVGEYGQNAIDVDDDRDAVMADGGAERIPSTGKGKEKEAKDDGVVDEGERGAWAIGEINGGFVGVPEWEGMFG